MAALPRSLWLASALSLASLTPSPAPADDSNFRPYLVGSRAAGMGGAFTALADDGSGPWYNPGGLAFVRRSQLSIAGSVYGYVSGSFGDALGDGNAFEYASMNTFPTATAAVWRAGGEDPASADVFSIGVFMPDAVSIDDRASVGSRQNEFFYTSQQQTIWLGLTWAHRFGRLGVGLTGFGIYGTRIDQQAITVVSPVDPSQFATLGARTDETVYGAAAGAGLRWDATDELRLGLSVYTPAVGSGRRRLYAQGLVGNVPGTGGPTSAVVNAEDLHASLTQPLRAQAGLAWTSGGLTLAADVVFLGAREVWNDQDRAAEGLTRWVKRNAVVNASLGAEILLENRYPVRAGFFTDFAASPSPSYSAVEVTPSNTSHVNRYGGSLSIGLRTEHSATDVGINVSGGSGQDLVPNNLDFSSYKATPATQFLVYAFLATAYEF